jgi:hypothetical protein
MSNIQNIDNLVKRLQEHTGCDQQKAQEKIDLYITISTAQILKHLNKSEDGLHYYISLEAFKDKLTLMVKGKRYVNLFDTIQSFPERIFTIITKGNNAIKKLTMTKLNYGLEELLIVKNDYKQLVEMLYADYDEQIANDQLDEIRIDLNSLTAYIHSNINSPDRAKLKDKPFALQKFNQYLYEALRIKNIAEFFNEATGKPGMPHIWSTTNSARRYYKGPNLQNTSKIVRHAALGHCYEYDMESSVFAWKYSWYREYCMKQSGKFYMLTHTDDYLQRKNAIRNKLAKETFGTDQDWAVKLIKEAITALGFGAPLRATGYSKNGKYEPTALNTIIRSYDKLELFINNPWVKGFHNEQELMNEFIMLDIKARGEDVILKQNPNIIDKRGALKSRSVVSMKYQQAEREILDWMIGECQDYEVLLTVHDCIYTRHKIGHLKDIRITLMELGDYYKISEQEHRAVTFDFDRLEHEKHIEQEEARAKGYKTDWADAGRVKIKSTYRKEPIDIYTGERNDFYDGSGYDGNGYYDPAFDPFIESLSEEEQSEYRVARNAVLNQPQDVPEWYKKL